MYEPQCPWPVSLCRTAVLPDDIGWKSGGSQPQRNVQRAISAVDEAYPASESPPLPIWH